MNQTSTIDYRPASDGKAAPAGAHAVALVVADRIYAERRRRDDMFPPDLFGEPAWDLLLAMFTARAEGRPMILCRAYKAAGVTDTTGRRLLDKMEAEGLISRRRAPRSRKMRIVELTDDAVERLVDYLTSLT